ncbi:Autolysin [compost metagenome]
MDGPQHLLVPTDKAELLTANLALMKPRELVDWQQYRVRNGDSLHGIANRYHVTVKTLKEINGLSSNHLRVGQQLAIPVEPGLKPDQPLFQTVASAPAPATARSHKVRRGDNLWSIARQYKVNVQDIKRWNRLKGNQLKAGQVLKLQGGATQVASAGKSTTKTSSKRGGRESVTYYKVKQGDSLYLIAKRFKVEMKHLQRWNPRSGSSLKPGQTLTLYLP